MINTPLNLFPEIYEDFVRLARLQQNILDVEVISTAKLERDHLERSEEHTSELQSRPTRRSSDLLNLFSYETHTDYLLDFYFRACSGILCHLLPKH